jgi:signal transduction histidine kinase
VSHAFPVSIESSPTPVPLTRRQRPASETKRSIRLVALRVPLVVKLAGANLVVVAMLLGAWLLAGGPVNRYVIAILAGVIAIHLILVLIALRPIRDLEVAAERVWKGDFGTRVERSAVADQQVLRIGAMFNILLDGLVADRARMRTLASEVIDVADRERAAVARELHDSTAQRLAALLLQLSAASRDCTDPALAPRLAAARDAAHELTEEVRLLSHTLHPRVLDDLGLVPALQKLAREASHGTGVDVDVDAESVARKQLPPSVSSVLYRVAQEAVRNAIRHGAPHRIRVVLRAEAQAARIEVHDDGTGFDLTATEQSGLGLLSMRERVSLVDGTLEIKTARGSGTSIVATVPLASEHPSNRRAE